MSQISRTQAGLADKQATLCYKQLIPETEFLDFTDEKTM